MKKRCCLYKPGLAQRNPGFQRTKTGTSPIILRLTGLQKLPKLNGKKGLQMLIFAYTVFILSILLILYHHIGYPLLLSLFAKHRAALAPGPDAPLNHFTFIIPMHNEAGYIAKKIDNLAALDYRKRVVSTSPY